MRRLLPTTIGALLLTLPFLDSARPARGGADPDPGRAPIPEHLPCAGGCAAVPALRSELSLDTYLDLVEDFADQPLDERSPALETLLFHGQQTLERIEANGLLHLDPAREELLIEELSRTHAWIDVRLIDEHGVERLRLGRARIPFGEKQHLVPELSRDLQPPEISGTVRRVGLKHLWARL